MIWESAVQAFANVIGTDLATAGGLLTAIIMTGIIIAIASSTKNSIVPCLLGGFFGMMIFTALGWVNVAFGTLIMLAFGAGIALTMKRGGE